MIPGRGTESPYPAGKGQKKKKKITMDGTCLRLLRVVLIFNPIDLLKEVADPIHLKKKRKSARAGWF